MWKALVGAASSFSSGSQHEDIDGKSISSEDHDVEIPGADVVPEEGGEASEHLTVHQETGVSTPQTPQGLEQLNTAAAWEPPSNLDLRQCEKCREFAYLRKKACVNSECVFQLHSVCQ